MTERYLLSMESAIDYKKARPDIALGIARVVAVGIPIYLTEKPREIDPTIPLADKWMGVRERLQSSTDNLTVKPVSQGEK